MAETTVIADCRNTRKLKIFQAHDRDHRATRPSVLAMVARRGNSVGIPEVGERYFRLRR